MNLLGLWSSAPRACLPGTCPAVQGVAPLSAPAVMFQDFSRIGRSGSRMEFDDLVPSSCVAGEPPCWALLSIRPFPAKAMDWTPILA